MTSEQIDKLAHMIALHLPGLVLERTGPQSKPIKPENRMRLYVESDDVKNIIIAALREVPPVP